MQRYLSKLKGERVSEQSGRAASRREEEAKQAKQQKERKKAARESRRAAGAERAQPLSSALLLFSFLQQIECMNSVKPSVCRHLAHQQSV